MNSLNDLLHEKFGLHKYRPQIKVRTDAFYEYLPSDNLKDQQVIARLGNTIVDLNDQCFQACVDPAHKYFTYTEEKCISACVRRYFQDFHHVVNSTTQRMQHLKSNNDETEIAQAQPSTIQK